MSIFKLEEEKENVVEKTETTQKEKTVEEVIKENEKKELEKRREREKEKDAQLIRQSNMTDDYIPERIISLPDNEIKEKLKKLYELKDYSLLKKIKNLFIFHGTGNKYIKLIDEYLNETSSKYKITEEYLMSLSLDSIKELVFDKYNMNIKIDRNREGDIKYKRNIVSTILDFSNIMFESSKF